MKNTEIFAQRLIELREQNGISQQQLADSLNITRQSLSLYEKAERTINIDLLVKIANYFNVSADYLLGLSSVSKVDLELKAICDYTGLTEQSVKCLNNRLVKSDEIDEAKKNAAENAIVTQFLNEYNYEHICHVTNIVISSNFFWRTINKLNELNNLSDNFISIYHSVINANDKSDYKSMAEQSDLVNKQHDIIEKMDLCRYNVSRYVEQVCNEFDIREDQGGLDNGKHTET